MEYTNILTSDYNTNSWLNLLNAVFGANFKAFAYPDNLNVDAKIAKQAFQLGEITLSDGNTLAVYEVELQDNIHVAQNRVAIRNLLRTRWDKYDGAFIANYKQRDKDWRFSFASETRQWNIDGTKYEKASTDSKRFTYLLGENETARTANERFTQLKQKGNLATLEDVKEAFSVEKLSKEFYKELFDWYQWALSDNDDFAVTYPNDTSTESDDRKIDEHLIRLITRLIFVWFIKQKKLIPEQIFDENELKNILQEFDTASKKSGNYYNAILQNLFFATLNRPINERAFASEASKSYQGKNEHYGIKTLFRDANENSWFRKSHEDIIHIFRQVPFLNGGLFECLDKEKDNNGKIFYYDGFSRVAGRQKRAFIPNCLFFDAEKGLISILKRYNFTIEENTPSDIEVALDPELLGKVFENLLGVYNPETKETARKQSGSFYTPREIVNYMVDESIRAYLQQTIGDDAADIVKIETLHAMSLPDPIKQKIHDALLQIKILDPACGSGAFPMGILNRIIDIFKKLDQNINLYKTKLDLIENCIYGVDIQTIAIQISKLRFFISLIVEQIPNDDANKNYGILPLPNLESKFIAANTLISLDESKKKQINLYDKTLQELKKELWEIRNHRTLRASSWQEKVRLREDDKKLCERIEKHLLENSVKPDYQKIKQNKLLIEKYESEILDLKEIWVDDYETQMSMFGNEIPQKLFQKDLNKPERNKRIEIVRHLNAEIQKEERKGQLSGLDAEIHKMISWNPYDQNLSSPFFDAEWMFGLTQGFDIVIGNPPYVFARNSKSKGLTETNKVYFYKNYALSEYQINLYPLFIEKGTNMLKQKGILTFITPSNWLTLNTNQKLRRFVLEQSNITILNFYKRVFESADVDSAILIFQKNNKNDNKEKIKLAEWEKEYDVIGEVEKERFLSVKDYVINIEALKGNETFSLLDKIEKNCVILSEIADVKVGLKAYQIGKGKPAQTEEIKKNRVFHSKTGGEGYTKYLYGADVRRYNLGWSGEYLKYGKHLAEPRTNFNLFSTPRILVRQIPSPLPYCINACYTEETSLNDLNSMNIIYIKVSPLYLLGILNSRLISYWFAHKFGKLQRGVFPQFKINELAQFPILNISLSAQQPIIDLTTEILSLKSTNLQADTKALEKQIDRLVYGLYGLTKEEIMIVEGGK
jgi:hypothetical protein